MPPPFKVQGRFWKAPHNNEFVAAAHNPPGGEVPSAQVTFDVTHALPFHEQSK
jgi:hypothetical protein